MADELQPTRQGPEIVASRPAREGVWRRTAHDTRRIGLSFGFLAAETSAAAICAAIGALIVASPDATTFEQVLVAGAAGIAGFLGVLALTAMWSLLRAPFRQRDETRAELDQVYLDAHPEFPRHALKVDSLWYLDVDDRSLLTEKTRVILVPITFTNREPTRRVNLDFELLWSRAVKGPPLGPYKLHRYSRDSVKDAFSSPLLVDPETTASGTAVFQAISEVAFKFGEMLEISVRDGYEVSLRVTDHVTGATIERLLESKAIPADEPASLSPGNGAD